MISSHNLIPCIFKKNESFHLLILGIYWDMFLCGTISMFKLFKYSQYTCVEGRVAIAYVWNAKHSWRPQSACKVSVWFVWEERYLESYCLVSFISMCAWLVWIVLVWVKGHAHVFPCVYRPKVDEGTFPPNILHLILWVRASQTQNFPIWVISLKSLTCFKAEVGCPTYFTFTWVLGIKILSSNLHRNCFNCHAISPGFRRLSLQTFLTVY